MKRSRLTPSERATLEVAMRRVAQKPDAEGRKSYGFAYGYLLGYARDAVRLLNEGRHADAERMLRDATERVVEFEPKVAP